MGILGNLTYVSIGGGCPQTPASIYKRNEGGTIGGIIAQKEQPLDRLRDHKRKGVAMSKPLRIAINGFGRIGRAIVRQWAAGGQKGVEVVAVNDIAPADTCAYLLEFDSVYGPAPFTVAQTRDGLRVAGRDIRLTQRADAASLDWSDVDIVFECTGKAQSRVFAQAGLRAGARRVLISGPSPVADQTIVLGANDAVLTGDAAIVSNASCTTNALAPLLAALDEGFGLRTGHMTTIHCYTGSQPTVDAPRGPALERNRAAAVSMVPTTTSAQTQVEQVLPHLAGRIRAAAVRVPTVSVSAIDLTCLLTDTPRCCPFAPCACGDAARHHRHYRSPAGVFRSAGAARKPDIGPAPDHHHPRRVGAAFWLV